jgi:hypothetical protein
MYAPGLKPFATIYTFCSPRVIGIELIEFLIASRAKPAKRQLKILLILFLIRVRAIHHPFQYIQYIIFRELKRDFFTVEQFRGTSNVISRKKLFSNF